MSQSEPDYRRLRVRYDTAHSHRNTAQAADRFVAVAHKVFPDKERLAQAWLVQRTKDAMLGNVPIEWSAYVWKRLPPWAKREVTCGKRNT